MVRKVFNLQAAAGTRPWIAWAVIVMATLAAVPSWGADSPEPTPSRATDPLEAARKAIASQRWPAAIRELRRVNATDNADWNNLLGFALRKQSPPDLEGAQRHYDAALRLDPRHKGALEYAGELALMKGDLGTAQTLLNTLEQVCAKGCEERADLEKAIKRFKDNGNRWRP